MVDNVQRMKNNKLTYISHCWSIRICEAAINFLIQIFNTHTHINLRHFLSSEFHKQDHTLHSVHNRLTTEGSNKTLNSEWLWHYLNPIVDIQVQLLTSHEWDESLMIRKQKFVHIIPVKVLLSIVFSPSANKVMRQWKYTTVDVWSFILHSLVMTTLISKSNSQLWARKPSHTAGCYVFSARTYLVSTERMFWGLIWTGWSPWASQIHRRWWR